MYRGKMEKKLLKGVVVVSFLAMVALPALPVLWIIPAFQEQIIGYLEKEPTTTAERLAETVVVHGRFRPEAALDADLRERISTFRKMTGLQRIKLFSPEGIIVYSTVKEEIGAPTRQTFFPAMLADGKPRSVVKTESDGRLSLETYVPLRRGNDIIGVCEIYYDFTELQSRVDTITMRGTAAASLLGFLLFSGTVLSLWLALRYLHEKEKALANNLNLQRQLNRQQWLESLSMLVGGVTHDFNNLLTALMGNIGMARRLSAEPRKSLAFLEMTQPSLQEMKRLLDRLLVFSKSKSQGGEPLEAGELVAGVADVVGRRGDIVLEWAVPGSLPPVLGRKEQLRRMVDYLVANAVEAMADGGILRLSAAEVAFDADNPYGLEEGRYLHLEVKDSGRGIAAADMDKIFVPYFTTKERGSAKGVGLGLTICFVIVRQHGGEIVAESEPGKGTTMHVYLPVIDPQTAAS